MILITMLTRVGLRSGAIPLFLISVVLTATACRNKSPTETPSTPLLETARASFYRGVELMDEGASHYDEALEAFQAGYTISPDLWEAHLNEGIVELRRGRLNAAAKAFQHSKEIYPSPEGLEALGEVYIRQGKADKAVELYERALASDPNDLHLRIRLAVALSNAGHNDQARAELRAVLGHDTDNLDAYNALAAIHIFDGDLDMAELILKKGISRHPTDPALLANMGLVALRRGNDQVAFQHFDQASKANPKFLVGRLNKAAVFLGAGDHRHAREELEFVLQVEPGNIRARLGLGLAKRLEGDLKGARLSWQTLLEYAPENPDAYFNLAVLSLDFEDDPSGARAHLLSFMELAPNDHPRMSAAESRMALIAAIMESE